MSGILYKYHMIEKADYIIVGDGVAGAAATESIRANDPDGSIKIFTDEKYPFYARMRLPEFLSGEISLERLILKNDAWYKEQGIDLYLDEPVIDADPAKKTITTKKSGVFSYQKLLLAVGSHSFIPPIKGADQKGVFSLRDIKDAIAIKEHIKDKKKGVIIGAGLLGLEAGKALMRHGIEIDVVEYLDRLLPKQLDAEGARVLKSIMEKIGYCFFLGFHIKEITKDNGQLKVLMRNGAKVFGDIVLISAGVRTNLMLARKLGLDINIGIVVNDHMQTSELNIFAAGDAAEHKGRFYGIWPAAKEQGKIAGTNMVDITIKYNGTIMENTLKVAGVDLVSIGDIITAEEDRYIVNIDDEKGIYKKYVIRDDVIVGCILLGDVQNQREIECAIKEKKKLADLDEDLLT